MKIAIVIDGWAGGNGAIVATERMVKELTARGHEIVIISTGKHEGNFEHFEVPGFYLPGVKESLENMEFKFGKGVKSIYRKAYKGVDIVQIQFPMFMARNAVKVANKMGIPVIGSCHLQPQNIISAMGKESRLMETFFVKWFNFNLFKKVKAVHCPSHFAADMLQREGSTAHMRVISNGIPVEYTPSKAKRPDWFGDNFVISNIGRHAMEKRQELLIDGVLRSKYRDNIQLLLCGKGEDSEKLKKRGEELPVKPMVDFVSMEDKLLYLNTSDLYLHSSVVELESLSCLEAIGCGLPCLIGNSPHSAAPQFALDDRFLFETDNADDLAKKIDYWHENRETLAELKQQTLQMAEYYRFNKCINEMEEFYRDTISGNIKESRKPESETGKFLDDMEKEEQVVQVPVSGKEKQMPISSKS